MTARQRSRGGGAAKCVMQDAKGATCLFVDDFIEFQRISIDTIQIPAGVSILSIFEPALPSRAHAAVC